MGFQTKFTPSYICGLFSGKILMKQLTHPLKGKRIQQGFVFIILDQLLFSVSVIYITF